MISKELLAEFEAYAAEHDSVEACALVIRRASEFCLFKCDNVSSSPSDTFMIGGDDYMRAEDSGDVVAILHSHPYGDCVPSAIDIASCNASNVMWMIFGMNDKKWYTLRPREMMLPLLGREFVHGVTDCYTLIRDWYYQERKILLPNFARNDEWWLNDQNLYLDNFKAAGFKALPLVDGEVVLRDLQVGDVVLMRVLSNVPNHGAIYLGNNVILHHLGGRLSCKEMYGGYYIKNTARILRYES